MRRVMMGDLVAAAAVLAAAPVTDRAKLAQELLSQAHAAHHYFKRYRRPHPAWGDGSLLTRALACADRAAPNLSDAGFLCQLALITRAAAHMKSGCVTGLPRARTLC